MKLEESKKVGQIVAENYRTAAIFKKYHIDFCCNGGVSLEQACAINKLSYQDVVQELSHASQISERNQPDFNSLDPSELTSYIEKEHHVYILTKAPVIILFLEKLCKVHGERHPELFKITSLFKEGYDQLMQHMKKEENILFPTIRHMSLAMKSEAEYKAPAFGSVDNPVAVMMEEHENEGDRFRQISRLSNDYTSPGDGCTTYKVAMEMLRDFEEDLHLHIHLENNILFPKAKQLEDLLTK